MEKQKMEAKFLDMLREYNPIVYKVASFYADENNTLDDLYQDVVLNLWKAFPNFREESQVSTWIYRITLNTCVSFYRKNIRRPACVEITTDVKADTEENEAVTELYVYIGVAAWRGWRLTEARAGAKPAKLHRGLSGLHRHSCQTACYRQVIFVFSCPFQLLFRS